MRATSLPLPFTSRIDLKVDAAYDAMRNTSPEECRPVVSALFERLRAAFLAGAD